MKRILRKIRFKVLFLLSGVAVLLVATQHIPDKEILVRLKYELDASGETVPGLEQKVAFIQQHFSSIHLVNILKAYEKCKQLHTPDPGKQVIVLGFDRLGVSTNDFHNIWNPATLPKTMFQNIDSILYTGEEYDGWTTFAYLYFKGAAADADQNRHRIRFFWNKERHLGKTKEETLRYLDGTMGEEIGHLNDWYSARNLTLADRFNMLYLVANQFQAKTFRDPRGFIHSIRNPSIKVQNSMQLAEYWGGLTSYYFYNPEWLKQEFPQDFELVDSWIHRFDPEFDPEFARRSRWFAIHYIPTLLPIDHVKEERKLFLPQVSIMGDEDILPHNRP